LEFQQVAEAGLRGSIVDILRKNDLPGKIGTILAKVPMEGFPG